MKRHALILTICAQLIISPVSKAAESEIVTGFQACDAHIAELPKYHKCEISGWFSSSKVEECPPDYFADLAAKGFDKRADPTKPLPRISPRCASDEKNRGKLAKNYSRYELDCYVMRISATGIKVADLFQHRKKYLPPERLLKSWMQSNGFSEGEVTLDTPFPGEGSICISH